MPLSMTMPVDVVRGNEKPSVARSNLLAAKVGSNDKSKEFLAIFIERVDEIPIESPPKQPRKQPMLESERRIYRALDERGEINFNATPLSQVVKYFRSTYEIPIVIDEKALGEESITTDEPITLELPPVSFRSALNLILDPLSLTYVIENEVLLITLKASALAEHPGRFIGANSKGISAVGSVGGMGGMGGMGDQPAIRFNFTPSQRYSSFQEAQMRDADAGLSTAGKMMTGARREYAAIPGPLATAIDKTVGVAFVCLPGDFQAVPIQAHLKPAGKRFVMLGQSWILGSPPRAPVAFSQYTNPHFFKIRMD